MTTPSVITSGPVQSVKVIGGEPDRMVKIVSDAPAEVFKVIGGSPETVIKAVSTGPTETVKIIEGAADRVIRIPVNEPAEVIKIIETGQGGEPCDCPAFTVPDLIDDAHTDYYYFGWFSVAGGWLVQRQDNPTGFSMSATVTGNPTHPDLASAWGARTSLDYS